MQLRSVPNTILSRFPLACTIKNQWINTPFSLEPGRAVFPTVEWLETSKRNSGKNQVKEERDQNQIPDCCTRLYYGGISWTPIRNVDWTFTDENKLASAFTYFYHIKDWPSRSIHRHLRYKAVLSLLVAMYILIHLTYPNPVSTTNSKHCILLHNLNTVGVVFSSWMSNIMKKPLPKHR